MIKWRSLNISPMWEVNMFGFSQNTLTESPSKHSAELASSTSTIGSKTLAFFKFKFLSFSKIIPILFVSLLFVGCGSSGNKGDTFGPGSGPGSIPSASDYYTVKFFDLDGITQIFNTRSVLKDDSITLPDLDNNPGFTVDWVDISAPNTRIAAGDTYVVTKNVDFKIVDKSIPLYTATFVDFDGNSIIGNISKRYDTVIKLLSEQSRTGYKFKGWEENLSVHTPIFEANYDYTLKSNVTFRAKYAQLFNVSFYGTDKLLGTETIEDGTLINVVNKYDIHDWFKEGDTTPLVDDINITGNINLYAIPNTKEINGPSGLDDIRGDLNGSYILTDDVNLSDVGDGVDPIKGWEPLGNCSNPAVGPFTGILNGNGHKVTDLWINRTESSVGLFSCTNGAEIKNLGVETSDTGVQGGGDVGAIAGNVNGGNITNSYSTGIVNATGNYAGGIAGNVGVGSKIINSYSTVSVFGTTGVGGIAGYVNGQGSLVTKSYSTGSVSATGDQVGGIIGFISGSGQATYNAAINPSVKSSGSSLTGINRVVGLISVFSLASNNFALENMTVEPQPQIDGDAGAPTSNANFKEEITYRTGLSWAFGDTTEAPWKISAGKNNGYPYLYWEDQ
jgi:hypothetical protein